MTRVPVVLCAALGLIVGLVFAVGAGGQLVRLLSEPAMPSAWRMGRWPYLAGSSGAGVLVVAAALASLARVRRGAGREGGPLLALAATAAIGSGVLMLSLARTASRAWGPGPPPPDVLAEGPVGGMYLLQLSALYIGLPLAVAAAVLALAPRLRGDLDAGSGQAVATLDGPVAPAA